LFFTSLLVALQSEDIGAAPDTPTVEQLWEIIQAQQAEIEALKNKLQSTEEKGQ